MARGPLRPFPVIGARQLYAWISAEPGAPRVGMLAGKPDSLSPPAYAAKDQVADAQSAKPSWRLAQGGTLRPKSVDIAWARQVSHVTLTT